MQSQSTPAMRAVARLVVRPKLVSSTKQLLKDERGMYMPDLKNKKSVNHDDARAYLKAIKKLINQVSHQFPIGLMDHMTLEERISSLEFGRPLGTVGQYIESAIRYRLSQVSEDDEPHNWCYLSDLALLVADIEAAMVTPA